MRHTFDAGLTAKPPRRSTGGAAAGCPGQVPPVDDPNPIALPHSDPTSVSTYEYAHDCGVASGEELGAMFAELTSVAAVQRMIERTPRISPSTYSRSRRGRNDSSQRRAECSPRAGGGAFSSPDLPQGDAGGTGRCGTGRGQGAGGKGDRDGGAGPSAQSSSTRTGLN